jgi:hypothetical protein
MNKSRDESGVQKLVALLETAGLIPLRTIRKQLARRLDQPALVESTIEDALERGIVDWVIDDAEGKNSLEEATWHLRLLTKEEQHERLALSRVKRALLRILWQEDDPDSRGEIPVKEAKQALLDAGFTDAEIETVKDGILNLVETYLGFERCTNQSAWWYRLIPEYERHPSTEYVEAMRKTDEELIEKQMLQELFLEELEKEEEKRKRPKKRRGQREQQGRETTH